MRLAGNGRGRLALLPAGLLMIFSLVGTANGQPGTPGKQGAPPGGPAAAATASEPAPTEAAAADATGAPPADAPAVEAGAGAGPAAQPPVPAASPDALSPTRLLDGPSLRETGRIAVAPSPMPMSGIENDAALPAASPKEKSIARVASSIDTTPAARPEGVINQRVLDREIGEHFQDIAGCRVEVARTKQVTPAQVVADKILLRWIIQPDGSTGSTDVVAILPVDLGIMDCAKRAMSQWTFTRPRGGPMSVERHFTFN
ncbi:MAG TPA: hypothetical protein VIF57_09300 [Polyangia bacterium]|jgi:hypothetical protein